MGMELFWGRTSCSSSLMLLTIMKAFLLFFSFLANCFAFARQRYFIIALYSKVYIFIPGRAFEDSDMIRFLAQDIELKTVKRLMHFLPFSLQ